MGQGWHTKAGSSTRGGGKMDWQTECEDDFRDDEIWEMLYGSAPKPQPWAVLERLEAMGETVPDRRRFGTAKA